MTQHLPAYEDGAVTVYLGDAREVIPELASEGIDCVVTSPPYRGVCEVARCHVWLGRLKAR